MKKNYDQLAEQYFKKYKDKMESLEKSPLAKTRSLTAYDYYVVGAQLEQFEELVKIAEADGNLNQLGLIPRVALDSIVATYGVSVMTQIASVQPIPDESGVVYFKNIRARTAKGSINGGNIAAGTKLTDPRANAGIQQGFAGDKISGEVVETGDGVETNFSFSLAGAPVRSKYVRISVDGAPGVFCQDDEGGLLLGVGVSGTINYETGAVVLNFLNAPANAANILADYQINYEADTDIPTMETVFESKLVQGEVFALKGTIGMIQSYAMRQRFGRIAEDELGRDLVSEVNKEVGGLMIRRMAAAAVGSTTFTKTAAAGVSDYAHRMSLKFKLAEAARKMGQNAGRGDASVIVAGAIAAEFLSTLPGWVKLYDGKSLGIHLYGTLDGTPVIRVLNNNTLDDNTALLIYKGGSAFEAAAVYAPFMPLTTTGLLPLAPNPLGSQQAAATVAGVEVLVPNFITKLVFA